MSPRAEAVAVCIGVGLLAMIPRAGAQPEPPQPVPAPAATGQTEIEKYLSDRNLRELLTVHLLDRLRQSEGLARQQIADRLGKLYVEMLDAAPTPEERAAWGTRSEELLKAVPEADSFDLRINLTKVQYLSAEEIAERHRLRMATAQEVSDAERELRAGAAAFQEIGTKVHRRVENLERREASGRDGDEAGLRYLLEDTRRQRSLAMYYAAWSNYYLAVLADKPVGLDEALSQFGWLLNAGGGRPASLERVPGTLLRYEHVARAAIGAGLCESMRGNHETALRWLDAVQSGEEVSETVRGQVAARRIAILARAKRWADLDTFMKRLRAGAKDKGTPDPSRPGTPPGTPTLGEVRLLAILTLEAHQGEGVARHARDLVQRLAEGAMSDLIDMGEVRHVLDLVSRYGTGTLAGEGFIVNYVRGLQAYDKSRAAQAEASENTEEPTKSDSVANAYRQAAASLDVASSSADAPRFPQEQTNAGLLLGLSLYYAGDLEQAADRLERVHASSPPGTQAEEALWLAVVALDRAVEGDRPSLKDRRDRLGALFLRTYPRTERAARLLLRRASAGLLTDDQAVETLLGVSPESPLYASARRHAAGLLYSIYRGSRGQARDFAALRFAAVAEEALGADRADVMSPDKTRSREGTERAVARVRQLLDAVLGMSAPDIERAARALETLDAIAVYAGASLDQVADEIAFRRLQIALARADEDEITRRRDELNAIGGRWADSAARLLYRKALAALRLRPEDPGAAREVVRHGLPVIGQFAEGPAALADPAVYTLHHEVAGAAALLWSLEHDESMRDLALRLDRGLLAAGSPSAQVLRRYAGISEACGEVAPALDAWRRILSGVRQDSGDWYEARYHSLRLLAASDPGRAREAMDQHKVLHPDFGPEPWGPMLRDLDGRVAAPSGTPAPTGGPP